MNIRSALTLAIVASIGAFTLINWKTVSAPTTIDFLVASIQAPLGIIFLCILGAVIVAYMLLAAFSEMRSLRESHATAKQMEQLHRRIDQSDASQIEALRTQLGKELNVIDAKLDRVLAALSASADAGTAGKAGSAGGMA